MTTATPKQKRSRAEVELEVMQELYQLHGLQKKIEDHLFRCDVTLFCTKANLTLAARGFRALEKVDFPIRKLAVAMRVIAREKCKFWMKKVKSRRSLAEADNEYWDRLKVAVIQLAPALCNPLVNIEMAERIVRTKISTNVHLLNGLPSRMRFWEKE